MFKIKLSAVFLVILFACGCGSTPPVGVKQSARSHGALAGEKTDVEDKWVSIVATVESYGFYARNVSRPGTVPEPVSSAAILRVDNSSLPGPQRIIIFFPNDAPESLVALFQAKDAMLEFRMQRSWFNAAAFQSEVIIGVTVVFVGALDAIVLRSQTEKGAENETE